MYCTLCAKWIGANSAAIKQHCLEYNVGSKENQNVVQNAHALKVEQKRQREANAPVPAPAAPLVPQTIVVNVQTPASGTSEGLLYLKASKFLLFHFSEPPEPPHIKCTGAHFFGP